MITPEKNATTKTHISSYKPNNDDDVLTDDQIMFCLTNVLNPDECHEAFSSLSNYLKDNTIESNFFGSIKDLLYEVNELLNNGYKNQEHIDLIIDLFYQLVRNNCNLADLLTENHIYIIFFPFIQKDETLDLFDWLLFFDHPLYPINHKSDLPKDHDQKQKEYDQRCKDRGYHLIAHYCIDNDIMTKLHEILNTPSMPKVLKVIRELGKFFFTFHSFIPMFSDIFNIIYNDPEIEHRSRAIDAISTFAGSSKEALSFFLEKDEFVQLFTDYSYESPEILTAILYCANKVMHISEYLDEQKAIMFLNFAAQFINENDTDLISQAIKIISNGTKNGEQYTSYALDSGIVQQLFQIIGNGLLPFKVQTLIFKAICYFFEFSNLENATKIVDIGFFNLMSEYLIPMTENNESAMTASLYALDTALRLATQYPQIDEWKYLIYNNEQIMQAIEDYDCGDNIGSYAEDSPQVYAHSFLIQLECCV